MKRLSREIENLVGARLCDLRVVYTSVARAGHVFLSIWYVSHGGFICDLVKDFTGEVRSVNFPGGLFLRFAPEMCVQ